MAGIAGFGLNLSTDFGIGLNMSSESRPGLDALKTECETINPFCVPLILSTIFGNLSAADIKTCRTINRTWCAEASRALQQKSTLLINSEEKMKTCISHFQRNISMTPGSQYIWNNIKLCTKSFQRSTNRRPNNFTFLLMHFFTQCGPAIRILNLNASLLNMQQLRGILQANLLPNVTKLTIMVSFPITGGRLIPPGFVGLPPVLPSVTEFCLDQGNSCISAANNEFYEDLISTLPNLQIVYGVSLDHLITARLISNHQRLHIREINDVLWVGETSLSRLREAKFPLTKLSIKLCSDSSPRTVMPNCVPFLQSIGETLTELAVIGMPLMEVNGNKQRAPLIQDQFSADIGSHLKKLHKLTISGFKGSLDFIRDFPNLKDLNINGLELAAANFTKEFVNPKLQALYADGHGALTPKVVLKLTECFPNLKYLSLNGLGDAELREIFSELPHLVELVVKRGRFTDEGITGLTTNNLKRIQDKKVTAQKVRRCVYIGSLPVLQKLELHSDALTDASYLCGFLECESLRSLSIKGKSKVSFKTVDKITSELELDCLNVSLDYKINEIEAKTIVEKMKGKTLVLNGRTAPTRDTRNDTSGWGITSFVQEVKQDIRKNSSDPFSFSSSNYYAYRKYNMFDCDFGSDSD